MESKHFTSPCYLGTKGFFGRVFELLHFPLIWEGGGRLLRFLSLVTVKPKRPPERQTTEKVFFRGSRVNLEQEFVVLDDTSSPPTKLHAACRQPFQIDRKKYLLQTSIAQPIGPSEARKAERRRVRWPGRIAPSSSLLLSGRVLFGPWEGGNPSSRVMFVRGGISRTGGGRSSGPPPLRPTPAQLSLFLPTASIEPSFSVPPSLPCSIHSGNSPPLRPSPVKGGRREGGEGPCHQPPVVAPSSSSRRTGRRRPLSLSLSLPPLSS